MSSSTHLDLPYLQASQAQKHVTMNAALQRLDRVVQLSAIDRQVTTPPLDPAEGDCYLVPSEALGGWEDWDHSLAHYEDGGWVRYVPQIGWRCYVAAEAEVYFFTGTSWQAAGSQQTLTQASNGHQMKVSSESITHAITAGPTSLTSLVIPNKALVLGITGTVSTSISGPATWGLGVSDDPQRYGNAIGTALDSQVIGLSGTPLVYWSDTTVQLTAQGSDFVSGAVDLTMFYLSFSFG